MYAARVASSSLRVPFTIGRLVRGAGAMEHNMVAQHLTSSDVHVERVRPTRETVRESGIDIVTFQFRGIELSVF